MTAATGFAVALALVRQGHPATATSSPTHTGSQSRSSSESDDRRGSVLGSSLGGGSIAPSSGGVAPVATSTS